MFNKYLTSNHFSNAAYPALRVTGGGGLYLTQLSQGKGRLQSHQLINKYFYSSRVFFKLFGPFSCSSVHTPQVPLV